MGFTAFAPGGLTLQASTGIGGFALQNATPTIVTWTAPNDGQMHRAIVVGEMQVSNGPEVGGQVNVNFTDPGGTSHSFQAIAAAQANGGHSLGIVASYDVAPNTTVAVVQQTPLTGGNSVVWAEIWGS